MKEKPIDNQLFELNMEHSLLYIQDKIMLITWAATVLFDSEISTCNYYDTSGNRIIFFLHIVFSGLQVGGNNALLVMPVCAKTCI